jgi:hypothetical protein
MSFADHAQRFERTPVVVVEVDLDYLDDGGDAVAAVNDDGSTCYRTPHTTDQAADDFTATVKTRRWMTSTQRPIAELNAIPCLRSAKFQAEEAKIGSGLSFFGDVSIELEDFVDDDRREDPFYSHASRSAIDQRAGTYFAKLMARNPYWTGREVRVIEGWCTGNVWHADDAITHTYYVRDVQGPSGGKFKLRAVGPLQLLELSKAEAPAPSEGKLFADISSGATSLTIHDATIAADYGATGHVRIGDEVIAYVRTADVMALTRAQFGTVAEAHDEGDGIQECVRYVDEPVADIIADLLTTYGGVPAARLDLTGWALEQSSFLSLYELSALITKPEKVKDLVQGLLESAAAIMWWDDDMGKLRLRAVRPTAAVLGTWNDRFHLLAPPEVKRDMTGRVSRADVAIELRTAELDPKADESYRFRLVGIEQGAGADEHGSSQVRLITSRWFTVDQIALAARASNQIVSQLRDGRQTIVAEVAAKDSTAFIGDGISVKSRDIVDRTGAIETKRCIVVKREAVVSGSRYRYTLEIVPFSGRYAFFTADDCPVYASASDNQKDPGAFYCDTDGTGLGSDAPYTYG